jgi:hypothetical protein
MGELVERDAEHLRLLSLGFYIMAGMAGFFSLFSLIYIGLGGVFASGVIPPNPNDSGSPRVVGLVFLGVGLLILLIGLALTFLTFWVGRSLKERRRRTFCLVMAGLSCLQIPWGTAIGICTILVLSRPSVKAMFEPPGPPGVPVSPAPV